MSSTRKSWLRYLPAALFLGAASFGYLRSLVYRAPARLDLPSLRLVRLDGTPLPPSTLTNRPIVLNFWAPWCPPCREEMPWFDHLQQQHPEVAIVGVEDDATVLEQALAFGKAERLSYPLVQPSSQLTAKLGHFAGLPTTLYLSRSGRVVHTVTGAVPEGVMQGYLADAIASK